MNTIKVTYSTNHHYVWIEPNILMSDATKKETEQYITDGFKLCYDDDREMTCSNRVIVDRIAIIVRDIAGNVDVQVKLGS